MVSLAVTLPRLTLLLGLLLLAGCSGLLPGNQQRAAAQIFDYRPLLGRDNDRLARFAPRFVVQGAVKTFNRIGSPVATLGPGAEPVVGIDTEQPALFAAEQRLVTAKGRYRNLVYRLHFPGVPFSLIPFHLTVGPGAGLLVVLTLDEGDRPLLVSVVHTCGCFLAMTPTSYLDAAAWPSRWQTAGQRVYGVSLPGLLDYGDSPHPEGRRLTLTVRSGTHRVIDVRLAADRDEEGRQERVRALPIRPLTDLEHLPYDGGEISFFETQGPRRGYVRNSVKPLEALLMGWWALDPYVGEDKALGPHEQTGVTFYTSLKIGERQASDMGNFAGFLRYWGWGL